MIYLYIIVIIILQCYTCLEPRLDISSGFAEEKIDGQSLFFELVHPEEISYTYKINPAKDFGRPWNESLYNVNLVIAEPRHGCSLLTNAEEIAEQIVLIERGRCSFVTKVHLAEKSGAAGALIMDNYYLNDQTYIDMVVDGMQVSPGIPSAFVLGRNGYVIRSYLDKVGLRSAVINIPVNVTGVPFYKIKQPPWVVWK